MLTNSKILLLLLLLYTFYVSVRQKNKNLIVTFLNNKNQRITDFKKLSDRDQSSK